MFDTVSEAEITLTNTGKVGFDFTTINMDPSTSQHPIPGVPVVIPHTGHIEANQQQKLQIRFLPGVPEKFHKSFEVSCFLCCENFCLLSNCVSDLPVTSSITEPSIKMFIILVGWGK